MNISINSLIWKSKGGLQSLVVITCLFISYSAWADGWMIPHLNLSSGLNPGEFSNFQKLNTAIWVNASKDFEYRQVNPIAEMASDRVEIYSILKIDDGRYQREFIELKKGADGDWHLGSKNIKIINSDSAVESHKLLRRFMISARFPKEEVSFGMDKAVILWECKLNPDKKIILQSMQFDLPVNESDKKNFNDILDVVMGEMPTPPNDK